MSTYVRTKNLSGKSHDDSLLRDLLLFLFLLFSLKIIFEGTYTSKNITTNHLKELSNNVPHICFLSTYSNYW